MADILLLLLLLLYKRKTDFTAQCDMRLTDLPVQQCNEKNIQVSYG